MLTDTEISQLSPAQRRRLIRKLTRSLEDVVGPPAKRRRVRVARLTLMITSVLVLIPWIVYLAITLPERYVATHWELTWVGFDVLLLVGFALTAVLAVRRRQLVVLSSFATGVLLFCDAWFDVTTAGPHDRLLAIASAAFIEVPIGCLLLSTALRFVRIQAERMWLMPPARHLWEVPLQLEDLSPPKPPADTERAAQPSRDGLAPA